MDSQFLANFVHETHGARVIQKAWRAYAAEKRRANRQLREDIVLGIVPKPFIDYSYRVHSITFTPSRQWK